MMPGRRPATKANRRPNRVTAERTHHPSRTNQVMSLPAGTAITTWQFLPWCPGDPEGSTTLPDRTLQLVRAFPGVSVIGAA